MCSPKMLGLVSDKVEVIAILKAIRIFTYSFRVPLALESNSSIAISWVIYTNDKDRPYRFQFLFNEIKLLSSFLWVHFTHILTSVNSMVGRCFDGARCE